MINIHRQSLGRGILSLGLFLALAGAARAQFVPFTANPVVTTNFFSGSIPLTGDITNFFLPDGLAPKPGVCVMDDANGLEEPPSSQGATRDGTAHPSAFNQRRIMTAYNPNLNGGTIYVGIDLPGGSGANSAARNVHAAPGNSNPNYFDGVVGGVVPGGGRGRIVPFDADGNGEADTLGRKANGNPLFRCPPEAADVVDIFNCAAAEASGATDNPRLAAGETLGAKENYVVTVLFGNLIGVNAELLQNGLTPAGTAQLAMSQDPGFVAPIGVTVSTSTGGNGSVLGYDVEFAFTNINSAVPDICSRLHQMVVVDSGSNRDGAGQGEDNNVLECLYVLPAALELSKACPTSATPPGGQLVFSGTVRNTGQVPLAGVTVTNVVPGVTNQLVFGPVTLAAGEVASFSNSYFVPATYMACTIPDTLSAAGRDCTNALITASTTTNCPIQHTLLISCPGDIGIECLGQVPLPNPAVVVATSTAGGVSVVHVGDIILTNGCSYGITRTYRANDACGNTNTCVQIITVRDITPPVLTGVPGDQSFQCLSDVPAPANVTATDNCDGAIAAVLVATTNGTCPVIITRSWTATDRCTNSASATQTIRVLDTVPPVLSGVPTGTNVQCLGDLPALAAVTATDNCDVTVTVTRSSTTNGTCPIVIVHRWSATDRCTNTVSASVTNVVRDTVPPVLTGVPGDQSFQCLSDVSPPANVTATDNCDGAIAAVLVATTNGTCPVIITRSWTATDRCTNSASATQIIRVLDTVPPVLSGVPTGTNVQCLGDLPALAAVTATDNCDVTVTVTRSSTTNGTCPIVIVHRWSATDRCTNTVSASVTNVVRDTVSPVLAGVPGDQSFQCLSDVSPPANVTATDNCDGVIAAVLVATTNGTCPVIITRSWTATDRCTNSTSATQIIRVLDTVPPVLSGVPTGTNVQCLGDLPALAAVTATDNCDVTVTVTRSSTTNGTCPIVIVHRWSATDRCTNTVSASVTNVVRDTVSPVLAGVPGGQSFQCLSDVPAPANVTATDNCDGAITAVLVATTNGTCPTIITRSWTATDRCTNSASATQIIRVLDTVPPVLSGVPTGTNVQCLGDLPALAAVTATDNCDVTVTVTRSSTTNGTCPIVIVHRWSATDRCTNTVSASVTNVVRDTVSPVLAGVPGDQSFQCLSDVPAPANVTATDNCDGVIAAVLVATTNGTCPTIITRFWTATDRCTNSASATQTIRVLDTVPPVLSGVPTGTNVQCLGDLPALAAVTATDNCDVTVTVTRSSTTNGTCPIVIVHRWSATDRCTNTVSASVTNVVRDTVSPVLAGVPGGQSFQCLSDVPAPANVTATDNCDGAITAVLVATTNGTCPTIITRSWTATDRCTNSASATQIIRVLDTVPPVLSGVPTGTNVQCLGDLPALAAVTATDNCDVTVTVTRSSTTNGTCPIVIVHRWSATDRCTNTVSASVTNVVRDTVSPVLAGVPGDQSFQCLSDVPAPANVTATDNCDGAITAVLVATTNGTCPTIITRFWTATDRCTNSASATQIIRVLDTVPPVLSGVPTGTNVQCLGDLPALAAVTATDNCDVTVTVTRSSTTNGTCPIVIVHRWSATDRCTNTVSASVTNVVRDTVSPVLAGVPGDQSFQCLSDVPAPANVTATDNCDGAIAAVLVATTNGTCPVIITRSWTATDRCTNSASATQTIRVLDTVPPVLSGVPTGTNVQCLGDLPALAAVTATDNCDVTVTVTRSSTTNGTCPIVIVHRWSATDRCTNTVSASVTNVVRDTVSPVLAGVPGDQSFQCLSDVPAPANVTATDNCDGVIAAVLVATTNGTCPTIITRFWTATDRCTNSASATQIIRVLDTVPPVLSGVPTGTNVQCLGDLPALAAVTATDNCDVTVTVTRSSTTNGTCPIVIVHRWSATDRCTNTVSASVTNVVRDTVSPVLAGVPGDQSFQCLSDVPAPANVTATDNCDGAIAAVLVATTNGTCPVIITRSWTATDRCTNSASATQTIRVLDTVPPVLSGVPTGTNVQCFGDLPPLATVTATDNCDATLAVTRSSTTNGTCPVVIVHTWTATDRCTNTVSASVTNLVRDNIPPVLSGVPADQSFQCLADVPAPANVTATDNCDGAVPVTATYVTNGTCPTLITGTWTARDRCTNSVTATRVITVNPPPILVSASPTNQLVCVGESATFCITASHPCGVTYTWRKNGVVIPGATANCLTIASVTAVEAGEYCVVVYGPCNAVTNCATLLLQSALGDFVWEDRNRNGCQDANEPGISDVVVQLIDCTTANALRLTRTDVNGLYRFDCVEPGNYRVRFFPPSPEYMFTTQTNPICGTTNDSDVNMGGMSACFALPPGTSDFTRDAGLFRKAALGDFVWHDRNNNGVQDPGEPGIPDALVKLQDAAGNTLATTNTDVNGRYLFSGLLPGSYKVMFVVPAGFQLVSPLDRGGDDAVDSDANPGNMLMTPVVTLQSGQTNLTLDAGFLNPAALGDFVWHDRNNNGVQDPGEPGIPNALVKLQDAAGNTLATTNTDVNGRYLFSGLLPGGYKVMFVVPAGFQLVSPLDRGGDDAVDSDANPANMLMTPVVTLQSGQTNLTLDAGFLNPAALGDFVWHDRNNNGVQDPGEPGIPNALVKLQDAAGNTLATTNTDVNGRYLFSGLLPGGYKVMFVVPAGFQLVSPLDRGGDDAVDSDANPANMFMTPVVTLQSGETNLTLDAGFLNPGALGDFVWEDRNQNGVQDPGEPGVRNVTVRLQNCAGTTLATTNTDTNGRYLFAGLLPGDYKVTFVLPSGFLFTVDNAGGDDALDSDANPATGMTTCYTLGIGETNRTVDAGIFRPVPGLRVTKQCPATPVKPGELLVFSGTVTNTGNVTLTNVTVVNDQPAPGTPVFGPVTLAPGEGRSFSGSYSIATNFAGCSVTDTLTARGLSLAGQAVSATATATCPIRGGLMLMCFPDETHECFGDIPGPDPDWLAMMVMGNNVRVIHVGDVLVTNNCVITNTRTYRATDACSNSATCTQVFVVRDTTPPQMFCPGDRVVECGTRWFFDGPPQAIDNCTRSPLVREVSTVTNATCGGTTLTATRTWEALDACSNRTTCAQTITVVDRQPPQIVCPKYHWYECGTLWDFQPPTFVDSCSGTNVTLRIAGTVTNGLCGDSYYATRTWEVIDGCGNRATCAQTVTVMDNTAPTLTCAPEKVVSSGTAWTFDPPTATDACGSVRLIVLGTVTNLYGNGVFHAIRTWRGVDDCGNQSSSCSQRVRVEPAPAGTNAPAGSAGAAVGYWPLNETAGNAAADLSTNARAGSLVNGPIWTNGACQGGLYFDGVNDYLSVPDADVLDFNGRSFTVALWIRSTKAGPQLLVEKQHQSFSGQFLLALNRDNVVPGGFSVWTGGAWIDSGFRGLLDGAWHHLAVAYDGTRFRLYRDGVLDKTEERSSAYVNTSLPLSFGRFLTGGQGWAFAGTLDEIRRYNRALGDSEVAALLGCPAAPTPAPAGGLSVSGPAGRITALDAEDPARVRLVGTAAPGVVVGVEACTDLKTWTEIGTATADENGTFEFVDSESEQRPVRYFRLIRP